MESKIPEWLAPAAWGAAGGAVAVVIVGLSAGWVVTSGAASEMAEQRSEKAVLAALTPVCVAQFRAQTSQQRQTQLAALEDESTWQQGDFVAEHGWATMPGAEKANDEVADACADKLLEITDT